MSIYESFKNGIMDEPFVGPIFYAWDERRLSFLEKVRRYFTGEDPRVIPVYRDTILVTLVNNSEAINE